MKTYLLTLVMLVFSLTPVAQTSKQKEVAAAIETLRQAMIDGNKKVLENATTDNLSYGHSSGRVENKEEFVSHLVTRKSDFKSIDLSEQTITITGNVAVVRHILSATTNDNGLPGTIKLKVLLVFVKEKTGWKLLARQAVKA